MKQYIIPFRSIMSRRVWLLGMVWGFFNMGMHSYTTWAGTFFIEMKGIPSDLSFFMASLPMLIIIPLGPVAGPLSDRFGRKTVIMASVLIEVVS